MGEINPLVSHLQSPGEEAGEETLARRELAEALRALCHALGASAAAPERLRELAATLRDRLALLDGAERAAADDEGAAAMVPGMQDFQERSPIAGRSNPLAPPARLAVDRDANLVSGEVRFDAAFEGAPGIVHGGFVAAVLDEALGMASALSGRVCMTAELTTRYRRHTPVSTPLRVEARLDAFEGRKVTTSGAVYDGDTLLVEGSGLFIAVDAEKFARLLAERTEKRGG